MCFGHDNACPFLSCIKENKELACYCHEERSCMDFYQIKETIYVQMKLYKKQDIDNVLHIQPMHICLERRQRFN